MGDTCLFILRNNEFNNGILRGISEMKSIRAAAFTFVFSANLLIGAQHAYAEVVEIEWNRTYTKTFEFPTNSLPNSASNVYSNEGFRDFSGAYIGTTFSVDYTLQQVRGGGSYSFVTKSWEFDGVNETLSTSNTTPYRTVTVGNTITHRSVSGIFAPDKFILDAYLSSKTPTASPDADGNYPDWYNEPGHAVMQVDHDVTSTFEVDTDAWLYSIADFFDDVSEKGALDAIREKIIDYSKSQHSNRRTKSIFVKPKASALGVRASISTNGTSIHTASPGILAYDFTFGDADSLSLPFAFGENKDGSTLEVFFEGTLLGSVNGDDYTLDELAFMTLDITNLKGQSGLLEFIINTTGPNSANVYIPDSFAVPVPAAVWLFSSGLLGLIGVARRKKAA